MDKKEEFQAKKPVEKNVLVWFEEPKHWQSSSRS